MRRRRIFLIAACFLSSVALGQVQEPAAGAKMSLAAAWKWKEATGNAADLYLPGLEDESWKALKVPANWHLAGQNLHGSVWFRRRHRSQFF